ncbi:hypothetical protein NQZ68_034892 [Dissostichus eleginoides]|nr:hypothetical protein NQZ68_034892 [Dissostichus eleginoides]
MRAILSLGQVEMTTEDVLELLGPAAAILTGSMVFKCFSLIRPSYSPTGEEVANLALRLPVSMSTLNKSTQTYMETKELPCHEERASLTHSVRSSTGEPVSPHDTTNNLPLIPSHPSLLPSNPPPSLSSII